MGVMPDRRASPWAVVGCPVGAQGRDLPGSLEGGPFGPLRSLPADPPLRLRGLAAFPSVPFTDRPRKQSRKAAKP